ncbi:TonB-dependent receptor [Sphingomonas endophytica]|uniref:TonB-dependent receptor n=1 Tax=Sphingomonas endophytica TaxID=869719 RepID=A0A147I4A0_9SPHN|nr:TonB-dependent receptor [Sphingomonas endophytica]KTT73083.1 TonB-dependent receptor [Sphingomonas endophytica]
MRLTATLLSTVAAVYAIPVLAQDQTSPVTTNAAVAGQTDTASSQSGDTGVFNAGDIVVTATRRAERLSDVPISINAVSQQALQNSGATDIRQMAQLAPSLNVSSTGSEANASARVRGVGTVGDNPGLESSVAVFIDGVYRSRTGSGLNDLGEVDRIEVLRGPQGTLSGRNSSAGAINIYTRAPSFDFGGYAEGTYGNYDFYRLAGAVTGPIVKDLLAFRIDGVLSKRDGFYRDVVNDTDYNDRNRWFVRGQLLLEPSPDLSLRLIGDYTWRNEKCCGAVYTDTREKTDPTPGTPGDYAINPNGNRIVSVMNQIAALRGYPAGSVFPAGNDPYSRRIAFTPGRAYSNVTKDYGGSAQIDWNLGGAALTSITAYREYKSDGANDIDANVLDIGYRPADGNNYRQFHTFTQELRLNGEAFGDRLNWLIGGFFSNEDLQVVDNLKFGRDYGAFAACRIVATVNPLAALRNPANPGCLGTTPLAALGGATARQALGAGFGQAAALILPALDRLSTLNDLGTTRDVYNQNSKSFAIFTHNIFKLTDTLSLTGGLRWTREEKNFDATFGNNNTVCPQVQALLNPLFNNAQLAALTRGIATLACTGNSSSVLNGRTLNDKLRENQFTGTAVLSWKPSDRLMTYASYSRGYKAGGYNLDRSDLGDAYTSTTIANLDARRLRFDPETVNAYEVGLKYSSRQFTFNLSGFRSEFKNFQLNTFNGTNYVVENIGSCSDSLNGADRDNSLATGACGAKVRYGVVSQGFEAEAGIYPAEHFALNMGYTFADTRYRRNLVGSDAGAALDPALFLLSGSQMSNAPRNVITTSVSWTPPIGGSGMSALFYVDQRTVSDYNTGSDLFIEKEQDGFTLVNARIGLRGDRDRWAIELWAQNLLDTNFQQVAFNAPFQGAGNQQQVQAFGGTGNQLFASFLGEPRTYGLTLRTRF